MKSAHRNSVVKIADMSFEIAQKRLRGIKMQLLVDIGFMDPWNSTDSLRDIPRLITMLEEMEMLHKHIDEMGE